MRRIRILHAEAKEYCAQARRVLNSFARVDYLDINRNGIMRRIADYDALIVRLNNSVDEEMLLKGGRLKVVAMATTGTNHIDLAACRERDVKVISLKGERKILKGVYSTAEHTFALILALLRKLPSAQKDVIDGNWRNQPFRGNELHGKTLGIIGYGRLGKMVASMGRGFGMNVIVYDNDPQVKYPRPLMCKPLDHLLKSADIITLHIPLDKKTKGFLNAGRIRKIKKGAVVINTSRGAVVDEKSLLQALKGGRLKGLALDVLTGEEKPGFCVRNHPMVKYARNHDNLIITPHIGGAAIEAIEKTDVFIAKKIKEHFTK